MGRVSARGCMPVPSEGVVYLCSLCIIEYLSNSRCKSSVRNFNKYFCHLLLKFWYIFLAGFCCGTFHKGMQNVEVPQLRHFAQCWHLNTWRFSMPRNIWPWWQVPLVSYGVYVCLSLCVCVEHTAQSSGVIKNVTQKFMKRKTHSWGSAQRRRDMPTLSPSLPLSLCVWK